MVNLAFDDPKVHCSQWQPMPSISNGIISALVQLGPIGTCHYLLANMSPKRLHASFFLVSSGRRQSYQTADSELVWDQMITTTATMHQTVTEDNESELILLCLSGRHIQ